MKLEGLPQKKLNLEIKNKSPILMGFLFVIKNSEPAKIQNLALIMLELS